MHGLVTALCCGSLLLTLARSDSGAHPGFERRPESLDQPACDEEFDDPRVLADLAAAENVFFLRTTSEDTLSVVELCAIASAARANPTRRINVFSNSLPCASTRRALMHPPNVHMVRYSIPSILSPLPHMLDWHAGRAWDNHYRAAHLADGLRLALLARFGGVYMDTDLLSLHSLDGLEDAVGAEDAWMLNNAVLALRAGHPFALHASLLFARTFNDTWWGFNGPRLVTRMWMSMLAPAQNDTLLLLPTEELYPISWRESGRLFEPTVTTPDGVLHQLHNARTVHVWNHVVGTKLEELRARRQPLEPLLLGAIMRRACPSIAAQGPGAYLVQPPATGVQHELTDARALRALVDCTAPDAATLSMRVWSTVLGLQPQLLLAGGTLSLREGAQAPVWGDAVPAPCGIMCSRGSVVTSHYGVSLLQPPKFAEAPIAFTVSFWLSTLSADMSLRVWLSDTPPAGEAMFKPDREQRIPRTPITPAADTDIRATLQGGPIVLALEDARVCVGDSNSEWMRSAAAVADGKWHHIAITFRAGVVSADDATQSAAHVRLYIDGLLHARRERRRIIELPVGVVMGRTPTIHVVPPLFIDELALLPVELTFTQIARIRNAQLLAMAQRDCVPARRLMESASLLQLAPPAATSTSSAAALMVLILTDARAESARLRMSVRTTWLQLSTVNVRHFFVVSASSRTLLASEHAAFHDLMFVDVPDSYTLLARKVMLAFRAAAQLGDFDFIIKTDHDVFLRLDTMHAELSAELQAAREKGHTLTLWRGFRFSDVPPLRDISDKNADISNTLMTFPPYTAGVAYVLSVDILARIAGLLHPVYTLNEDQCLGIWVLQAYHAGDASSPEPQHDVRFQQWSVCTDTQITVHPATPAHARLLYSNIVAGQPLCSQHPFDNCCLCCGCPANDYSWFVCDPRRGAVIATTMDIASVGHMNSIDLWAEPSTESTSGKVQDQLGAVLDAKWRSMSFIGWLPHSMTRSSVNHAALAVQSPQAVSSPLHVACEASCALPLCGATLISNHVHAHVALADAIQASATHTCDDVWLSSFGAAVLSEAEAVPAAGLGRAHLTAWSDIPVQQQVPITRVNVILITAAVSTLGACVPVSEDEDLYDEYVMGPRTRDAWFEDSRRFVPRAGSFGAFCGFFVDVMGADGSLVVFRSPFARNASTHVHYDAFVDFRPVDIVDVIITVIVPRGWTRSPVVVSALRTSVSAVNASTLPSSMLTSHAVAAGVQQIDNDPRFLRRTSWLFLLRRLHRRVLRAVQVRQIRLTLLEMFVPLLCVVACAVLLLYMYPPRKLCGCSRSPRRPHGSSALPRRVPSRMSMRTAP